MGLRLPVSSKRTLGIALLVSIVVFFLFRTSSSFLTDPTPSLLSTELDYPEVEVDSTSSAIDDLPSGVREFNEPQLAKLEAALARGIECGSTPETQLVMAGHNWAMAYTWGATGGETYW